MSRHEDAQALKLHRHQAAVNAVLARLQKQDFVRRFLARDPTLWKQDEEHAKVIKNRMGWLEAAGQMLDQAEDLKRFAEEVRGSGIRHVALLGMGGSSLCPDVLRQTFPRRAGFPVLLVLDTTDPEAIAAAERTIDTARTLFIVASKSGTTIESQMLYQHFARKAAGDRFAAITDPGTALEELARSEGFRRVFTSPPDIGGRYSALSCFGMVPAACIGIDIVRLLERGDRLVRGLQAGRAPADCPPIVLGAALAALGMAGRDKVTFVMSRRIATFACWAEQLVAESTGKEGKGLVPVEGEDLGPVSVYGKDRVFVHLKLRGAKEPSLERKLAALRGAGHPCIVIRLEDLYDLGAEFNRWEIATAVAGSVLEIDPFDEPNVKESKDNTGQVLEEYRATGKLPSTPPDGEFNGVKAWTTVQPSRKRGLVGLEALMDGLCRAVRPGDYIALMAYLRMDATTRARLQKLRLKLRARCKAATTLGFGPRFLHSTGQLHKGGAGNAVFIQITGEKAIDLPIPGERVSFGVLQAAQAAGDFASLASRRYRLARLHLGNKVLKNLDKVIDSV